MSQDENNKPTLQAGKETIEKCPECGAKFSSKIATNVKHKCPNPQCGIEFIMMIFE